MQSVFLHVEESMCSAQTLDGGGDTGAAEQTVGVEHWNYYIETTGGDNREKRVKTDVLYRFHG